MDAGPRPPKRSEAAELFGPLDLARGRWANSAAWCRVITIPEDIALRWVNSGVQVPTRRVYVHRWMAEPLLRALQNVRDRGLLDALKTYDGCFNVRSIRGRIGEFSWHSYALAIDLNASENPLGAESKLSAEFVQCFKDEGFLWGGDFARKDPQHFQYAEG